MKKTKLFKSLLVAAGLCVGASAWAGDKTVVKYSFDDANSPNLTTGSRVSFDYTKTSVITSTTFLNAYNNTNGDPGSSTISLGSTDLSEETWTLSFEWAAVGGCNSKADHTTLKAGDTSLFDLSGNSNWNTTVTLSVGGTATATLPVPGCDKNKRFTADTGNQLNTDVYWHHFVITGNSDGVKLTITNSSTGNAIVTDVVLSATNVNPTSLIIEPCCGGAIGLDELSLSYYVEGEVIQTPTAAYTNVDGINRTITAACDTEGTTLYYSTDGENWTEGASATVSESGNIYFKAVKGSSESEVLTFAVEAGEEIKLNAPTIYRSNNTTVTISADQTAILLSPEATVYYTYGEESGSFKGSKTITVEADAVITAYAEAEGYTTSQTSERAVALFPTLVNQIENTATKTSGWSAHTFSSETITASERTYAALLLDEEQWGNNIYLQTDGEWGLRASGNWYVNSNTQESWILMQNMKKGDIIVVDVTYPASSMVNATYSKYAYGSKQAYEVTEDGNVELAFKKINASTMDYLYGVYAYREAELKNIFLNPSIWDVADANERYAVYAFSSETVYGWYDFTFDDENGALTTSVPDCFSKIILTRMNGNAAENNWDNKWNQTEDIDFTKIADNTLFTITGWGEGENAKSTYETSEFVKPNTYTATFTTNLGWQTVKAYVWSGEGENAYNKALGDWAGTEMELVEGTSDTYTISFKAAEAPEWIIFNYDNNNKTTDLAFVDGKAYVWNKFTQTVTYTNPEGWENVNAFIWTENEKSYTNDWPGNAMTKDGDIYTISIENYGEEVDIPGNIIFNNGGMGDGNQTLDLVFQDGKEYSDGSYATLTVSDAGYATYCHARALDFTNVDGITAYTATQTENKISFHQVEATVPGNNGLLLKGTKGAETKAKVPFVQGGELNAIQNVLVGVLTETHVDKGAFVLMNGDQGVGFYKTNNDEGFTVRANSAYIPAQTVGEARTFIGFDFDNTTTAIEGVATVKENNGEIYNLQGQRVMKAQKGLYIIDGKKVMVK